MKAIGSFGCALVAVGLLARAGAAQDDLNKLSDEFGDAATAGQWQRVEKVEGWNADQLELFDVNAIYKGYCALMPFTSTWYRDYRGVLLFKPVKGDFVMTTRLRVTGRDGKSVPQSQFSLAGLMVRAPRAITPQSWQPGGENYVFISLGAANRPGTMQFEHKTTIDSDSQIKIEDADSPEAHLQIARLGEAMIVLARTPRSEWRVLNRYRRADFPDELQCGMTTYTDYPTASQLQPREHNATVIREGRPDVGALFDFVRFAAPKVPASLQGRDFSDAGAVPDAELLRFLGASALGEDAQTAPGFATGAATQ